MLQEEQKQQQILVTQAKADLAKARENVEIQKRQNDSDVAAASLAWELARLDLESFKEGQSKAEVNRLRGEVLIAQEDLAQKIETYEFFKRIAKKGYKTQNELESARIAVTKAENELNVKKGELEVLQKYTNRRTLRELEEMADEGGRELDRVRRSGLAALAQFEAELKARELTYEVEVAKLERLNQQIAACKLYAPQDGQVVYANESRRRSEPTVIEAGATVRERQTIINLPDLTQMKVDARIHESKISQVRTGLDVIVRVDAVPNEIYHGVIDSVSSVPVSGSWPNTDLKEYEAIVRIIDSLEKVQKLKPGLTASIEIIVQERDEPVLQIPVQSVVTVGEKDFAYVLTADGPQRRELHIGASNDTAMEVLDGVREGERVIMNPRSSFADEIAELELSIKNRRVDARQESPEADVPADAQVGQTGARAEAPAAGKEQKANDGGPQQEAKPAETTQVGEAE